MCVSRAAGFSKEKSVKDQHIQAPKGLELVFIVVFKKTKIHNQVNINSDINYKNHNEYMPLRDKR